MLKRLPLRAKLTLLFAGAIALVLLAVGIFVFFRVKSDLDDSIDQALRTRAGAIRTRTTNRDPLAGSTVRSSDTTPRPVAIAARRRRT